MALDRSRRRSPSARIRRSVTSRDELRRRLRSGVRRHGASSIVATVAGRASPRRLRRCTPRKTARDWLLARIQSVLDYVQNPDTRALPGHELDRRPHRPVRARPVPELPRRDALARDADRDHADRARRQRPPRRDHDLPDARPDRRHRRVELGDGHRLAGARRDRPHGRDRRRPRRLGGRERRRSRRSCGRSTTSCRRCRSSSTSSRSST